MARSDRDAFEVYAEKVLVPELSPGDVVVMDNLSSHKGPDVRALIEKAGAILLYLPPLQCRGPAAQARPGPARHGPGGGQAEPAVHAHRPGPIPASPFHATGPPCNRIRASSSLPGTDNRSAAPRVQCGGGSFVEHEVEPRRLFGREVLRRAIMK